jgi:hypothetical protein
MHFAEAFVDQRRASRPPGHADIQMAEAGDLNARADRKET